MQLLPDDLRGDLVCVHGSVVRMDLEFVDQVETLPSGKVPACTLCVGNGLSRGAQS
jgi:hypothetical protein